MHYVQKNPDAEKSLIFVHGLGTMHACWEQQVDYFSCRGYQVIALDLPGFGNSKIIQGKFDLDLCAECIFQLAESLDLRRLSIIGHSMGGPISLHCCYEQPWRFDHCVLISTFSRIRPTSRSATLALLKRFVWANFQDAESQAAFIAQRTFPNSSEQQFRDEFKKQILGTDKIVYRQAINLMARINLKQEAQNLKVPVLVITGMQDQTISPRLQYELFCQLPNANQFLIKEGHHGMIVRQAALINATIESTINSVQE